MFEKGLLPVSMQRNPKLYRGAEQFHYIMVTLETSHYNSTVSRDVAMTTALYQIHQI